MTPPKEVIAPSAPEAPPCRKGGVVWANHLFKFGKDKCVQCGAAEMRQFRKPA